VRICEDEPGSDADAELEATENVLEIDCEDPEVLVDIETEADVIPELPEGTLNA
jgi:hypothetical protein